MSPVLDPRVARGTRRMLDLRQADLAMGETHLGWKAAFGSPSGLAAFGLERPLVGYLTQGRRLASGATVPLLGWVRPALEAEIAVHLAHDVAAGPEQGRRRCRHRWAVGGDRARRRRPAARATSWRSWAATSSTATSCSASSVPERRDLAGVSASVTRDGVEVAPTDDPEALTGALPDVVTSIADTLAPSVDERLRAGDVVITGPWSRPLDVAAGEHVVVEVAGLGSLEVTIR